MADTTLIEPTLHVVGNGVLTKTKLAELDQVLSAASWVHETCWRFDATPAAGEQLLRIEVRCKIIGKSVMGSANYDLANDVSKNVASGYCSYWYEAVQGGVRDTSEEYWIITGEGIAPAVGLTSYNDPQTIVFDVTAYFSDSRQPGIIYDPNQRNEIIYDLSTNRPMCYV